MTLEFENAESPFKVKCDVHPWMGAYIGVFDHPYFSVSNKDGAYNITELEPGEYVIEIWQEMLGFKRANITVKDGANYLNFTFKRP